MNFLKHSDIASGPAKGAGWLRGVWRTLRTLSDDDAYERYCEHVRQRHPEQTLLSRREFYLKHQHDKWSGINRCC